MNASNVIALLGGVALFLFGMSLMGDGLKQAAGNKMEIVLYKLSSTPLKGILLGTAVTAVIQSSSATSVMVVGFVNSAMMSLKQAVSVIMGSILGTSITGWIIALSELGTGNSGLLSIISTSTLTGLIAVAGIILRMTAKTSAKKHLSSIMLGFAVLMYGISAMSSAVAPLKESEKFISLMTAFSNPILGILAGTAITAVLQSASSAAGLLQALSVTGAISFSAAFPILLGINIGASAPVLMSSIGVKPEAKRAAFSYLLISLFGSLLVGALFYAADAMAHFAFTGMTVDAIAIAAINTLFRLASLVLLFPFMTAMEKLLHKMIPDAEFDEDMVIPPLEERFLASPAVALERCHFAADSMAQLVGKTFARATVLLNNYTPEEFNLIEEHENISDRYEDKLGAYLVKICSTSVNEHQSKEAMEYLHVITDLERISDHALNIAECAQEIDEKKIVFSEDAVHEIEVLSCALEEIIAITIKAFVENDTELAVKVEPLEETIDNLCDEMKDNHIKRLQKGICTLQHGFVFNDLMTNFERVSDHCSNIALAVLEADADSFDVHTYADNLAGDEQFEKLHKEYSEKFKL